MKNIDWLRTLNPKQLADWYYDFWQKEQSKYNSSYGALIWWLQQDYIKEQEHE